MVYLKAHDTISVVATSSGTEEIFSQAMPLLDKYFADQGYRLSYRSDLVRDGADLFSANSLDARVHSLIEAVNDPSTSVIWAFRGGYGAGKLLPMLDQVDLSNIKNKTLIGFSDITALHIYFHNRYNIITFHAPVLAQMLPTRATPAVVKDEIFGVLTGQQKQVQFELEVLSNLRNEGVIEGVTEGGNLELVKFSLGTPWEITCENKIIFLEEVNDQAYRYDRSFFHFVNSRAFVGTKAIILGRFTCTDEDPEIEDKLIKNFAKYTNVPIFRSREFGHIDHNRIIPLNCLAKIIVENHIAKVIIDL